MTTTDNPPTGGTRARAAGSRGFVAGSTEARPGVLTSEFMLTLLTAITLVIAGYVSEAFPERLAWILFAGVIAAYVLSRGIAKAGSKEGPFVGQLGDRDGS
jgi:hypothetical protein